MTEVPSNEQTYKTQLNKNYSKQTFDTRTASQLMIMNDILGPALPKKPMVKKFQSDPSMDFFEQSQQKHQHHPHHVPRNFHSTI